MPSRTLPLLAVLVVACAPEYPLDTLSEDERVAVEAAIDSLEPVRAELPVEDAELERMAVSDIEETRPDVDCDVRGVLSGVWYAEETEPVFEGSWFELGTGTLGGTLDGAYAEGLFDGTFGDDPAGTLEGSYGGTWFRGTWTVTEGDDAGATGELGGRYEQRNELGGYFFGLWGDCGA